MDTARAIREEAYALASREGLEALSLRRVAHRVGLTAPAIYRHYDGKAKLVEAVTRSAREEAGRRLVESITGIEEPRSQLRALVLGFVRFARDRPGLYGTLTTPPVGRPIQQFPADFHRDPPPAFRLSLRVIEACMEAGVLERDDPLWVTLAYWTQLHGLIELERVGYFDDTNFEEVVEEMLERLEAGLGP